MDSQRMISSSDKQRYSNTVVEFPQPLRENPCTNGHFQLIFLMRVRTGARPRALATLAARLRIRCAPGSPPAQPTPPTTLWLARFARIAFGPGARSALRAFALRPPLRPPGGPWCRAVRGERLGPYLSALPPYKGCAPVRGLRYPDAFCVRQDVRDGGRSSIPQSPLPLPLCSPRTPRGDKDPHDDSMPPYTYVDMLSLRGDRSSIVCRLCPLIRALPL